MSPRAILLTVSAIAPSPVTLQAVPNESMATYAAIISAICDSSKPSCDCSRPTAAMIAPPGTPGAATIMMPSIRMKPSAMPKVSSAPVRYMTAKANRPIFIIEPDRCTVAHRGMTNPATDSLTPLLRVDFRVTGMVAADDDVPSAVKYAGSMFFSARNGLTPAYEPASRNWRIRITQVISVASTSTFRNADSVSVRLPFMPIDRNMPKMNGGSSGMTNFSMTFMITDRSSSAADMRVSDFTAVMAMPTVNANRSADITAKGGSISMVKYGANPPSSMSAASNNCWSASSHE